MSPGTSANVARYLALRAETQPDGCALKSPTGHERDGTIRYEETTFAELNDQTGQVARAMQEAGIRPGTRVLLMVRPGSDLIRCAFALFKAGAVPVVIDPGMGLRHFLQCVRRTRPTGLVGIPLAHWTSRIFRSAFRDLRHRVRVDRNFASLYDRYAGEEVPVSEPGPDELAAILFTSGSTGPPKGVCYGHGQFDAQVRLIRETFGIEPGEVDLPMLPVFALFNPALGMTTVVPEINPNKPASVEPEKILQAIRQCGVSNSFGSPVLWGKIAAHAGRSREKFPGMQRILLAGAPVPPALVRQLKPIFPEARLWSPYGATECLPVSAIDGEEILRTTAADPGKGTCVGRPVAGVRIQVIGIEAGPVPDMTTARPLPPGGIGEIIATGPTVTRSYDGLPEATARAKIADAEGVVWHRMGDAGTFDEEGRLWFCGRIAERVDTHSGILYTDPVERIFNELPGVRRSALIGIGEGMERRPAIVIEPDPGQRPRPETILAEARHHSLTRGISTVLYCRSFPVDVRHNAKINRLELARRFRRK